MIIIINGCPSSGKTSIIKEMQNLYTKPLLYLGIDNFWKIIPDQYKELGEKAAEGYSFIETVDAHNNRIIQVNRGPFAHHIDFSMASSIKCLADCGNDVAVDLILHEKTTLDLYAKALADHTVYFIGLTCSLEELERREKARNNRTVSYSV